MLYMKIWKIACHEKITEDGRVTYEFIYDFLCDIESMVYDFMKSLLIDAQTLRYKGSLLVAGLVTICIDLFTKLSLPELTAENQPLAPYLIDQVGICIDQWDIVLERLFNQGCQQRNHQSIPTLNNETIPYHFANFGIYILQRQQRIYKLYRIHKYNSQLKLLSIYKERAEKYYEHDLYEKNTLKKLHSASLI